jgi:hypothetical protein
MVHHKCEYSIRSVAEITDMNPITLRAWELRYQLVVPRRGKNGRRFILKLKNIIKPILMELGEIWQKNQYGVADEHFFSCYIRNEVGARLLHLSSKQLHKHTLLLACLPGELHDLGLLCFALHAMENGFNF